MGYAVHEELIRSLFEDGLTYAEMEEKVEEQTGIEANASGLRGFCRRQDWFEYRPTHLRALNTHTTDTSPHGDDSWKRYY